MKFSTGKLVEVRVAAAFVAVLTSFAIYSLTPSVASQIDNKLNALFSQCSSSLVPDVTFNHAACSKLFTTYSNVAKSSSYQYLSDEVMFELHRTIVSKNFDLDIAEVTQGYIQILPSGKYYSTDRKSVV